MRCSCIAATVKADIGTGFSFRPRLAQFGRTCCQPASLLTTTGLSLKRPFGHLLQDAVVNSHPRRSIATTRSHRSQSPRQVVAEDIAKEQNGVATGGEQSPRDDYSGPATVDPWLSSAETRRSIFINLMRTVVHPVVIITARKQDVEDDALGTVAATVSSFNTVSVSPDLIVSFNLKTDSITHQTICDSKCFTVTFPNMSSEGAKLAEAFTKGNHPPPFITSHPDRPTPLPVTPLQESYDKSSFGIKYYPPAVSLTEDLGHQTSGVAFTLVCEHHNSITVGDHVIVTGRVTPLPPRTAYGGWGAMGTGNAWAPTHVTLAHVHGIYSNSDTGLGFADLWRSDDPDLKTPHEDVDPKAMIEWYEERLLTTQTAQMWNALGKPWSASQQLNPLQVSWLQRAMEMPLTTLQLYESHYIQRLQYWTSRLVTPSDAQDFVDRNDLQSKEPSFGDTSFSQLPGHMQLFVRNKTLLSVDDLNEEISLYKRRLAALASDERSNTEETDADEVLRLQQLREHFRERIHLLKHALILKSATSPATDATKLLDSKKKYDYYLPRFNNSLRYLAMNALKKLYRRYQTQLTESRLCKIGLEQASDTTTYLRDLDDRIKFFEPRQVILADVIRQRAQSTSREALINDYLKMPKSEPLVTDEGGSDGKSKAKDRQTVRTVLQKDKKFYADSRSLARSAKARADHGIEVKNGESVDQLDHDVVEQAVPKVEKGSKSRDYLVIQHADDEAMPSPEDFVDAGKLREQRMRDKTAREKEKKQQQ